MIAEFLRMKRDERGMSQGDLASALGLHRNTVARWEQEDKLPRKNRQAVADLFGVPLSVVEAAVDGKLIEGEAARESWQVRSLEDLHEWRNAVAADPALHAQDYAFLILIALPMFFDRDSWVVSVTIDAFVERTHTDRAQVEAHWPEMLASGYVERVGVGEWTLRLVFPAR